MKKRANTKELKYTLLFLVFNISLFCISCNDYKYNCFEPYKEPIYDRKTMNSVDSIINTENGCKYSIHTFIQLKDSTFIFSALMYSYKDKIWLDLLKSDIEDFIFFDFDDNIGETKKIQIKSNSSIIKEFDRKLKRIILQNDNTEVYEFCVYDFYPYYDDDNVFRNSLEVIFFVTKKNGIIGSYLTDMNAPEKNIISPGGNIFEDYIDYSEYVRYRLL